MKENSYVIIKANCSSSLVEEVNNFLNKHPSFRPFGGVCVSKDVLYQALFCDDALRRQIEKFTFISE